MNLANVNEVIKIYGIPEPRYYLEPKEGEVVGYCAECGQNIYAGEDIWEIKG